MFSSVDSNDAEDRQTRRVFVVIPVPSGTNCVSDAVKEDVVRVGRVGGWGCIVVCDGVLV